MSQAVCCLTDIYNNIWFKLSYLRTFFDSGIFFFFFCGIWAVNLPSKIVALELHLIFSRSASPSPTWELSCSSPGLCSGWNHCHMKKVIFSIFLMEKSPLAMLTWSTVHPLGVLHSAEHSGKPFLVKGELELKLWRPSCLEFLTVVTRNKKTVGMQSLKYKLSRQRV